MLYVGRLDDGNETTGDTHECCTAEPASFSGGKRGVARIELAQSSRARISQREGNHDTHSFYSIFRMCVSRLLMTLFLVLLNPVRVLPSVAPIYWEKQTTHSG